MSDHLTQLSNAPLTQYTTINTVTGEIVDNDVIKNHLAMLMTLVNETGEGFLGQCWSEETLDALRDNVDDTGRKLPSAANAAADRLGLRPVMPEVHASSRVERLIKSLVISQLRSQVARRDAYLSILNNDTPEYADELFKNVERATKKYLISHDVLPADYTKFCSPRFPKNLLRMGSVDAQYARGNYDPQNHAFTMDLNVNKVWYSLVFTLPDRLHSLNITKVCLPNIRLTPKGYRFDVCIEHTVPNPGPVIQQKVTHRKPLNVLGVDLGHTNTAVMSIVSSNTNGEVTYHEHSYSYDDMGQRDKLDRLRSLGYDIRNKRRAYENLQAHPDKAIALTQENSRVERKRANLGKEMAYDLAQYVLSLCKIFKVDAVALEDLRFTSSTGKSPSKSLNLANSTWSHAQIAGVLQQVLNKQGILLVHVNARNTSKSCPSCDEVLMRTIYHQAMCPCGVSMDRDQAASISIAKRGLLNLMNKKTKLPKDTVKSRPRLLNIPPIGEKPVRVSRDKTKPTPKQTARKFYSRRKYPSKYPLLQGSNGTICKEVAVLPVPRVVVEQSTYNSIVTNLVLIQ